MLIGITGATSTIGVKLAAMLRAKGHEVRTFSRNRPSLQNSDVQWSPLDLADLTTVTASKLDGVELMVHLAAKVPGSGTGGNANTDYWDINVLGTQRLLEAMAKAGVGRLVLAGAANAYDCSHGEVSETSAFHPRARVLYLGSKVVQEWHAAAMCEALSLDYAVLRISSVVGDGKSVVDNLARQLARGNQISIVGDGAFGADFISCHDVCQGLVLAIEKKLSGIYNLSSGQRTLLLNCVLEMANLLDCGSGAIRHEKSNGIVDPGFPAVNCERLQAFGYAPTPIKEVLEDICIQAKDQISVQ